MRILVCGGREYIDRKRIYDRLDQEKEQFLLIQGGAKGADALARQWAKERGEPSCTFDAQWGYHGKKAGPIRNFWMMRYGLPDLVIAFPGGKGTASMIAMAKSAGVKVEVIT